MVDILSKIIMSQQYHHLGMMRSKRLRHIRNDRLDIAISRACFLSPTLALSLSPIAENPEGRKKEGEYINPDPIRRLPLP